MTPPLARPDRWSNGTWANLERLMAADPAWVKPAMHPELFGVTSQGVALATYLLDRGLRVLVTPGERGRMWVPVLVDGRELDADLTLGQLREVVGQYADSPLSWRAIAMARHPGLRVAELAASLRVSVTLPFRVDAREDLLDDLGRAAKRIRLALDAHPGARGGGYADMVDALVASGLPVPRLPASLRRDMRRVSSWCWTTEGDDANSFGDYLMENAVLVDGAVADHVMVSHRGHGLNSYAVTWRMAFGPLAFQVQDAWGGAFGSPEDNGRLAALFQRVSDLVRLAEQRLSGVAQAPSSAWMRPVVVSCSPLRDVHTCQVWDPLRGQHVHVSLGADDPWRVIGQLIETCTMPSPETRNWLRQARLRDEGTKR